MFGNILIVLILIFYISLVNLMLKPAPGGDYSVGYAFTWMIYLTGFLISTGLLSWNMNLNHSFDWLPASLLRYQGWLLFFGWISFVVAIAWSMEYHSKWIEGEFPAFMRWFPRSKVYIWLPALMLIPALYLLNAQRQEGFAPSWIKTSLTAGFVVSILIGLGIFYGFAKASVQRRIAISQAPATESFSTTSFNLSMDEINKYNDSTIQGLLTYTHREKDERLRTAAVAKIKSYEDWEAQLIHILEQGELHEKYWVYAFLDGNNVEHPEGFIEPIQHSLERLAPAVKTSLQDRSSLNMGYINIEALCRVLDTQFKDSAAQFRPEMVKLQKSLEVSTPERTDKKNKAWFDDTLSASRLAVKNWLESNQ